MAEVREKVNAGVKPSSVELDDDGIIVRLVYHAPRKLFCDPVRLSDFLDDYEKDQANKKFVSGDFSVLMLRGNRLKMTFFPRISGHAELILPKDKFIQMVKDFFKIVSHQ